MSFLETKDMIRTGQFKTCSLWQMLWQTRVRGASVVRTLQVPRRNMLGRLTTTKVWIIDPKA